MGIVTNVILPLALAFIMFALGLGLTVSDFARVARQPKDFFVGAVSQIVLLPLVAFMLVTIWPVSPEIALGVMIIAAAPGGVTSNLLTAFGRGDVALSISLTAVISLLSVLTIPLIVGFSYGQFFGQAVEGDVSVARIAISVFLIVTVPVLIGLAVRHYAERFALRFEPAARKISAFLFVVVLLGAIFQERDNIVNYYAEAGLITEPRPEAAARRGSPGSRRRPCNRRSWRASTPQACPPLSLGSCRGLPLPQACSHAPTQRPRDRCPDRSNWS